MDESQSFENLFENNHTHYYQNRTNSFLQRFKSKQTELKNKFKIFIKSQNHKYQTNKKKILQTLQGPQKLSDSIDIRKVRSQKKYLTEEFKRNRNAIKYIEHTSQENEKTFHCLKRKVEMVENVRSSRRSELRNLDKTLRQIKQQIMQQKKKYRKSITQSKQNTEHSRLLCERQKIEKGKQVRNIKIIHQDMINAQKLNQINNNRTRCSNVRQIERKNTNISVSRVYLQKRNQADELKVNRLIRELAQRQQLRINVQNLKKIRQKKQTPFMQNTTSMGKQIQNFRKSLGQKSFFVQHKRNNSKIKAKIRYKSSYTQGKQQFQDDTLNPSHLNSHLKNHSVQLFAD